MLHDLPVELQDHIASSLCQADLRSLLLCSRKAYASFLPALYRNVDLTVAGFQNYSEVAKFDTRLSQLVAQLCSHPEQCSWVSRASFAWSVNDLAKAKKIRTNMLKVFELLPSLQNLVTRQTNDTEFYHMTPLLQDLDGSNETFVASCALSEMPASTSLQSLVFEDAGTSLMDIYRLFGLSALHHLTILNFHDRSESLSSFMGLADFDVPASLAPASNIQHLSFLMSCPPAGSERYEKLFMRQRNLESLTWEIFTRDFICGSVIGTCLYAL